MKKIAKYCYFIVLGFLLACHDKENPIPGKNTEIDTPEARESFFKTTAAAHNWKLSKLRFSDSTVVAELSEDPLQIDSTLIIDLFAELPACRKDHVFSFGYEFGNVSVNFNDEFVNEEDRCDPQEPTFIEKGIYLDFNDSLSVAMASFRNNDAVHQFFGFKGSRSGSGYLGYQMEWRIESLSVDSMNMHGIFNNRGLPDLFIQFLPSK